MEIIAHDIGFFDTNGICPDLVIENGDLKADTGLQNAVLISLWSNRFVRKEDLPTGEADQMGWWADTVSIPSTDEIGSQLWVAERSKVLQATANRMKDFAEQALQWLIEGGVAQSFNVSVAVENGEIVLTINIISPQEDTFPFKFVWDGQRARFEQDSL